MKNMIHKCHHPNPEECYLESEMTDWSLFDGHNVFSKSSIQMGDCDGIAEENGCLFQGEGKGKKVINLSTGQQTMFVNVSKRMPYPKYMAIVIFGLNERPFKNGEREDYILYANERLLVDLAIFKNGEREDYFSYTLDQLRDRVRCWSKDANELLPKFSIPQDKIKEWNHRRQRFVEERRRADDRIKHPESYK